MKKFLIGLIVCLSAMLSFTVTGLAADVVEFEASSRIAGSTGTALTGGKSYSMKAGNQAGFKINFETSPSSVSVLIATASQNAGMIELRLDSATGPVLGTLDTKAKTDSTWKRHELSIPITEDISGPHNLWVVFAKGTHDFYGIKVKIPNPEDSYITFTGQNMFSDLDEDELKTEINLLAQLGILNASPTQPFDKEALIVKRDFVRALAGFYSDDAIVANGNIFADITTQDPDYKAFAVLANAGVLKSDPNASFNPNTTVTLEEACGMCCKVLGYGYAGNTTKGYLQMARELGLLSGVKPDSVLKKKDMTAMLYNMLWADYAQVAGISKDILYYDKIPYILERTRSLYSETGIVSANQNYNIYSTSEAASPGTVIIDDETFKVGKSSAASYVGFKCTYFYEYDGGKRTIVGIVPDEDCTYSLLSSRDTDFYKINQNVVSYTDEDDKEKKFEIDSKAIVMYNGRPAGGRLESLVGSGDFTGQITLINNDGDRKYDVIFVEQPRTIIFGGVSKTSVYDLMTKSHISIGDSEEAKVFMGQVAIDWEELETGNVLDLYESKNTSGQGLYRLYVSYSETEGIITESENDGWITLDNGMVYKPSTYASRDYEIGRNTILRLNGYGQYVELTQTPAAALAIALNSGDTGEGSRLDPILGMECLTEDNKIQILNFHDKVYADGVLCTTTDELLNGKTTDKGSFVGLVNLEKEIPIRYFVNFDGKITSFDTPNPGTGGIRDVLTELFNGKAKFATLSYMLKGANRVNLCPVASDYRSASLWASGDRELYGFDNKLPTGDDLHNLTAYATEGDTYVADLIIWSGRTGGSYQNSAVFDKLMTKLGDDGEADIVLRCVSGNSEKDYVINDFAYRGNTADTNGLTLKQYINSLRQGDIVQFILNGMGEIIEIQVNYFCDGSAERVIDGITLVPKLHNGNTITPDNSAGISSIGTVTGFEDNFIKYERTDSNGNTISDYANITSASGIVLCEKDDRGYEITANAPKAAITVGSKVIISQRAWYYDTNFVAIYR